MSTIHLTGGIDVGNGYVKGLIRSADGTMTQIDLPSGVSIEMRSNQLPTPDAQALEQVEGDFFNNLDASFTSPLVPDQYRRLFGRRSLSANGAFEEFDVQGRLSKAEQSLSKSLVIGLFAAQAFREYVKEHKKLPTDQLKVVARAALALPIDEFMRHRVSYAESFKHSDHTVTIHNFETPVFVKVSFKDIQVIAEGASAQLAIAKKGEPLMEAMLRDLKSRGMEMEGITAKDVLAARHTIGIDIGEGTVNFPVFTGRAFNADSSRTFGKGWGTVLSRSMEAMENARVSMPFNSRKRLAEYLTDGPNPIRRQTYDRVKAFVDEEAQYFAQEVAVQFGHVLNIVGAETEVVYVYGGGATQVKDVLYPKLIDKVRELSGLDAFPILYLDSSYSRHLNREGLLIAARSAEKRGK